MSDQTHTASSSPNHLRFNATVNILDGAFFGFALGVASFTTIIPLFVSQMTESAVLIGLGPAIHMVGWQLPQLFTANRVRRLSRFKPMVLAMTIHERMPFLGLALLAWFLPGMDRGLALALAFVLMIWQGFGGGLTANVWQSMIAKIIPSSWHGGFLGIQMAAVNLLGSGGAVAAGLILERYDYPLNFTLCFALASLGLVVSFLFLASTREDAHRPALVSGTGGRLWEDVRHILTGDRVFQRFLVIRMIIQLGLVAFSFYSVHAFRELGVSAAQVGWLTGLLIFTQVIFNPIFGALGDRKGHWLVLLLGTLAAFLSAAVAGWMTSAPALFVSFALAGVAFVVAWTTTMVLSLGFGTSTQKSTYIGLSNTVLAPVTFIAPFLAGWCIETFGYPIMFRASAAVFLLAAVLSFRLMRSNQDHPAGIATA